MPGPEDQTTTQTAPLTFKEEIMQHAANKFGGNEHTTAAPAVEAPVIDAPAAAAAPVVAAPPATNDTPPAEAAVAAPAAAETAAPAAVTAPDYNAILNEISGGVVTNLDSFKAVLPQIQQFETIQQRNTELEAEIAKNPFASDYVKKLNELIGSGAKPDQIEAFQSINRLGEVADMPSRDALINHKVLIEGYPRSIAEMKVDKEFDLASENLLPAEKEIMQADMDVAARGAKDALAKYKADISTIPVAQPEESALKQQALVQTHTTAVKAAIPQLVGQFVGIGAKTLTTKVGDDVIEASLDINYSDDFKAKIPAILEDYFMDGLTPITPENIEKAKQTIRAHYVLGHEDEIMGKWALEFGKKVKEHVDAIYENRSGIKPPEDNPDKPVNSDQSFKNMQERIANGGRPGL